MFFTLENLYKSPVLGLLYFKISDVVIEIKIKQINSKKIQN